jgi:hypothetical protein
MNEDPRRDSAAGAEAEAQLEEPQLTASPISIQRFRRAVADASETHEQLIAALAYARAGLPIFPCCPKSKRPLCVCGFKDATTQEKQIRTWWTRWPDAMIGLPTGAETGVFVLDVDRDENTDGFAALASLEKQHGNLPETLRSVTPRGGSHYFFRWHNGIKNNAGKLGLGIDVRGEGGYVILPPSRRDDGKRYEWAETSASAPVEAPQWLTELCRAPKGFDRTSSAHSTGKREEAYASKALETQARRLACTRPGTRNNAANAGAYSMGRLVARGWIEVETVEARLFDACCCNGLVNEDGEAKVRATLRSGIKAGIQNPQASNKRSG